MQQQEIVAAFPNPPLFYKLVWKGVNTRIDGCRYANYKSDGNYAEDERIPPPPPAPPEGTYKMFGLTYTTSDVLPTLEDEGRTQLYPKGEIDHVSELKKLNRSLLFNYLELLDILIKNPDQYKAKVDNIELLFVNIHHLLNSFRPHQGREVLIESMEKQIARRKAATQHLEGVIEAAQKTLYATKNKLTGYQKSSVGSGILQPKLEQDVEMGEASTDDKAFSEESLMKLNKMQSLLDLIKNNVS